MNSIAVTTLLQSKNLLYQQKANQGVGWIENSYSLRKESLMGSSSVSKVKAKKRESATTFSTSFYLEF